MTSWTLLKRSLVFYARAHLGVLVGAAIGSAALTGALIVGDSMRASLFNKSLQAIGPFAYALGSGDRFFTDSLAPKLEGALPRDAGHKTCALLVLPGIASHENGAARANHIQVVGCTPHFLTLMSTPGAATAHYDEAGPAHPRAPVASLVPGDANAAFINPALALQLRAKPGDEVLIRVPKPGALSREVTLTERDKTDTTLRLRIAGILEENKGGDFSLQRSQVSPLNLFVSRETLTKVTGQEGRANLLLVTAGDSKSAAPQTETAKLQRVLREQWTLGDASLEVRQPTNTPTLELRSPRVFLDAPVIHAARSVSFGKPALWVLTYLANLMQAGSNTTPYSFVTAAGPPLTPEGMRDNEIVVNQWLAEDLQVKSGDRVAVSYFLPESGAKLEERTNSFTVRAVVPMDMPWSDRTLMPDFPGIEKAESTGDWEVGFELVYKIRPKDEDYWRKLRGTPKAFVTEAAGQRMWANRFGDYTAIRWAIPTGQLAPGADLEGQLLAQLEPGQAGLNFEPIRNQAKQAAANSQDFGQLFLGFSFFLVVAALLLVGMLFQFGLEQRTSELGTLLALGFTPRQTRRFLLYEGAAIALAGSMVGVLAGALYAKAMLWGLTTLWHDATHAASLQFSVKPLSVVIGIGAGTLVAVLAIWLTMRKLVRQPALSLLGSSGESVESLHRHPRSRGVYIAIAAGLLAVMIAGVSVSKGGANAGAFFGAGALLLVAGLGAGAAWLAALAHRSRVHALSLRSLGIRASSRRRKRSLAIIALLACGSFLIASISVFRLDATRDALEPGSGTGGFALIGETTMPILDDLNSKSGRDVLGLNESDLQGVRVVSMRVRQGDDASCLNLNRAQKPRLLGVQPELLNGRFTFVSTSKGLTRAIGWKVLTQLQLPENEVAAVGDANSIQWAMGKKVGDTIDYTDERGRAFKVRIVGAVANSVLQGSLLINEQAFVSRFPSESGYRSFLVDAPQGSVSQVSAVLTRALQDFGLELTPTAQRLNDFNAVQNTYLSAFQVLGGMGLLLGSAGLGVVVLRNVLERRGELGLLSAVGFSAGALQRMVLSEHTALLACGLGIGIAAAVVAVLPALLTPGTQLPYRSLVVTLGTVVLNGFLWTWLATRFALRGNLLAALRNE